MDTGWKVKEKKLETCLMVIGSKPKNMQPIKNLLDQKEKTIQTMKMKLKIPVTDHAWTEEFFILQQEREGKSPHIKLQRLCLRLVLNMLK